jgi:hypothetical protein
MKKVSLRIRNFDKERFLTFNIDNDASLDEELLDFIEDEEPKGIVPVIFEEGEEFDTFSYNITDKIHLCELSNQEINAEMVLRVLHSLVASLIDMAEYRIPLSYLVLHRDYIYVDSDYRIEFICIPVEEMQEEVDINSFLRAFLASLRYELSENCNYVAKLLSYVNNTAMFNLRNMVTLVEELMEDMDIALPEEDSTEIYVDYQEVMEEAEELEEAEEEKDAAEEPEVSEELEELEEEAESEDEEDVLEEDTVEDEQEESVEDEISSDEEEETEEEQEEEPVAQKPSKKSAFSLREPEPEEEEEEEITEKRIGFDVEEDETLEEEPEEELEEDEILEEEDEPEETDEDEVEEVEEPEEEDFENSETEEDSSQESEPEEVEEEKEKTPKKTLFKTKETTVTGVVIEDELDEFLAEKEREDQISHFEDNGLKIKKNIKVNRASIVKNTQEELKAEEEEAKAEEENVDEEEEEEVVSTSILSQTLGATGILKGATTVPKVNPYLIRTNTKERVMITKQNFKIGKASMGVDYTVKGNGAVSRTHAIITNKDGVYYIKDNKSTNHTYVNNKLVEDGESELLTHDCKIVLGDEEFTFKLR